MASITTNLNLNPIVLTSSMITAAYQGSLSSEDWNDTDQAKLLDLINMAEFINNILIPMFTPLPSNAIAGIQGSAIYGDTVDQTSLFYDDINNQSLTIADSLRQLNTLISTQGIQITSVLALAGQLQQQLNASNQYDLSIALNNLTSSLTNVSTSSAATAATLNALQTILRITTSNGNPMQTYRTGSTPVEVIAEATSTVAIAWTTPFLDNNYTTAITLQGVGQTGTYADFIYTGVGQGIQVSISNPSTSVNAQIYLNVIAVHD